MRPRGRAATRGRRRLGGAFSGPLARRAPLPRARDGAAPAIPLAAVLTGRRVGRDRMAASDAPPAGVGSAHAGLAVARRALTARDGPAGAGPRHRRPAACVETRPEGPARLYVCGITPYDATHMGHAATYVAFDLLNRAWRNAGHEVTYVQNVTDVDDPLLERADQGRRRLARAGRARDRAVPRGHGGAAGPPARRTTSGPSSRSRWSSS